MASKQAPCKAVGPLMTDYSTNAIRVTRVPPQTQSPRCSQIIDEAKRELDQIDADGRRAERRLKLELDDAAIAQIRILATARKKVCNGMA